MYLKIKWPLNFGDNFGQSAIDEIMKKQQTKTYYTRIVVDIVQNLKITE